MLAKFSVKLCVDRLYLLSYKDTTLKYFYIISAL